MYRILKTVILLVLTLSVISCATPMTKADLDKVRSVGIINKFPEYPNYALIGTTIFNNDYDSVKDKRFFEKVTNVVAEYLTKKGYKVSELSDKDIEARKRVDLVLEIIPRDIYQTPGTFGYGVNQRSMFGYTQSPTVYVALNIGPYLHGNNMGNAFYNSKMVPVFPGKLPAKWDQLSQDKKEAIYKALNKNIEKVLTDLLVKVGL